MAARDEAMGEGGRARTTAEHLDFALWLSGHCWVMYLVRVSWSVYGSGMVMMETNGRALSSLRGKLA